LITYLYVTTSANLRYKKCWDNAEKEASSIIKSAREEEKKAQERSEALLKQAQEQVSSMLSEAGKS